MRIRSTLGVPLAGAVLALGTAVVPAHAAGTPVAPVALGCITETQNAKDANGNVRGYAHYQYCRLADRVTVNGTLTDSSFDGYCSKIEVSFSTGGYRYKQTCTDPTSFSWTERGATAAHISAYAF
ncbi:hypothetical protein [Streptomyces sp. NPDC049555]|uniref:hypothetical protein n=1 Tax=Streptomyces sp. NPDC049555 TaxID=3154930 RepID=UPI00344AB2C7